MLVAATALGSIPCILVELVPRVRVMHRTPVGEIVVDARKPRYRAWFGNRSLGGGFGTRT
jgi:hypothetical protein